MAQGIKVIDARNKDEFAAGFIPGSINIQGNNSFATWAGWLLKYDEQFIMLADEGKLDDLTRKLMRIGLDNIYGYIGSTVVWTDGGGTLEKVNVITLADNLDKVSKDKKVIIHCQSGDRSSTEVSKICRSKQKYIYLQ